MCGGRRHHPDEQGFALPKGRDEMLYQCLVVVDWLDPKSDGVPELRVGIAHGGFHCCAAAAHFGLLSRAERLSAINARPCGATPADGTGDLHCGAEQQCRVHDPGNTLPGELGGCVLLCLVWLRAR